MRSQLDIDDYDDNLRNNHEEKRVRCCIIRASYCDDCEHPYKNIDKRIVLAVASEGNSLVFFLDFQDDEHKSSKLNQNDENADGYVEIDRVFTCVRLGLDLYGKAEDCHEKQENPYIDQKSIHNKIVGFLAFSHLLRFIFAFLFIILLVLLFSIIFFFLVLCLGFLDLTDFFLHEASSDQS